MKILTVIVLSLALLTFNFSLRSVKGKLNIHSRLTGKIFRFLPVMELLLWTIFVLWSSNYLFADTSVQYIANFLLLTLCFVLVFWFFIKDYISGIQIKTRFNLAPGKSFKSKQGKGIIRKVGILLLEIKTENGSNIKIPFSQIDQKTVELNFEEKRGGESTFKIELDSKITETVAMQKITQLVINSPWTSYKSAPTIKVKQSHPDKKTYEISCVTIVENGVNRLKELIIREFSPSKK